MRRLRTFVLPVVMMAMIPGLSQSRVGLAAYDGYAYSPAGSYVVSPDYLDRIGVVLGAIDSPSRRSDLAESWLQFSKSAITRNLEFQDQWLNIQRQQLRQDHLVDQQRVEIAKLQLQIEQLRAENLRLERENLQMRLQLNHNGAGQGANQPAAAAPNESAGAAPTNEPAPQTPPAGRR